MPPPKITTLFEPGFPGCDGERDRALNHVGIERRTIVGALKGKNAGLELLIHLDKKRIRVLRGTVSAASRSSSTQS